MPETYEERLEARVKEYRRTLVAVASIEADWQAGGVSAQEAMLAISEVLRKATEE